MDSLNKGDLESFLNEVDRLIKLSSDFKLDYPAAPEVVAENVLKTQSVIPDNPVNFEDILNVIRDEILPRSVNPSSPKFLSYPYAGNSKSGILGSLLSMLLHQNVMKMDWGPYSTMNEIELISWMRDLVGFKNNLEIKNIKDSGGVITHSGTMSNSIAMLIAKEHFNSKSNSGKKSNLVLIPENITHYGIIECQKWLGLKNNIVEVKTKNFRYDISDLESKLKKHKNDIMSVVVFAGDAKTMTIDNLEEIAVLTKSIDSEIWLHLDAAHGFSLAFSEKNRFKLRGIHLYDSITLDPHKAFSLPFGVSILLINDSNKIDLINSDKSKNDISFSRITPFVSTRPWIGLSFWFFLKINGKNKIGNIIDKRIQLTYEIAREIKKRSKFQLVNEPKTYSVLFFYTGSLNISDINGINLLNQELAKNLTKYGYFISCPSICTTDSLNQKIALTPMKIMSGNELVSLKEVKKLFNLIELISK